MYLACIASCSALISDTLTQTLWIRERPTACYFATALQSNSILTVPCASKCISVNLVSETEPKVSGRVMILPRPCSLVGTNTGLHFTTYGILRRVSHITQKYLSLLISVLQPHMSLCFYLANKQKNLLPLVAFCKTQVIFVSTSQWETSLWFIATTIW